MSSVLQILLRMSSCFQITIFSRCSRTLLKSWLFRKTTFLSLFAKIKGSATVLKVHNNLTFSLKIFLKCRISLYCTVYNTYAGKSNLQIFIQLKLTLLFMKVRLSEHYCSCRFFVLFKRKATMPLTEQFALCCPPPSSCLKFLHLYFKLNLFCFRFRRSGSRLEMSGGRGREGEGGGGGRERGGGGRVGSHLIIFYFSLIFS